MRTIPDRYTPRDVSLSFEGTTSMTKQADAEAADINNIMRNYNRNGFATPEDLKQRIGQYADVTAHVDYNQALNLVREADALFADLPAHVRSAFDNDPSNLVMALHDETRVPELRELGIYEPKTEPAVEGKEPPA